VRTVSIRILLPLTILVAAPMLGWGGRAQAGYMTPASVVASTNSNSLSDGAPQADLDGMGASAAAASDGSDSRLLDRQGPMTLPIGAVSLLITSGTTSTGAGGQPVPYGPGVGNPNTQTTVAARPQIDLPTLVGVLFLEESLDRLPPFPSRLFRPPRHSCA
jgi:hypothetical protein